MTRPHTIIELCGAGSTKEAAVARALDLIAAMNVVEPTHASIKGFGELKICVGSWDTDVGEVVRMYDKVCAQFGGCRGK